MNNILNKDYDDDDDCIPRFVLSRRQEHTWELEGKGCFLGLEISLRTEPDQLMMIVS